MSQGVVMNIRSPTSGEFDHDTEIYLKIAIENVVCKNMQKDVLFRPISDRKLIQASYSTIALFHVHKIPIICPLSNPKNLGSNYDSFLSVINHTPYSTV